jgi:dihydroorotate dehydrogenase
MSGALWRLTRPALFALDAETAHHAAIWALSLFDGAPGVAAAMRRSIHADREVLAAHVGSLRFPNCVGLAAGLDKNAEAVTGLFGLGFGAVEVGTVTPRPQPGNPLPRLFRVPPEQALINRMGFNNDGAAAIAARLRELKFRPAPVGANLGKNKDTPLDQATTDYVIAAERLAPVSDYLVVNLSSPNTPGLRTLQEPQVLERLLKAVRIAAGPDMPLWLKIAPDLGDEAVDAAVDVAIGCGLDALIATNTTLLRPFFHPLASEAGGLSGAPVRQRSTQVVRRAFVRAAGRLPIVGVGGIFSGADAWEKIRAGASLVQLYTGFVYGGPMLVKRVLDELEALAMKAGITRLADAVGLDA